MDKRVFLFLSGKGVERHSPSMVRCVTASKIPLAFLPWASLPGKLLLFICFVWVGLWNLSWKYPLLFCFFLARTAYMKHCWLAYGERHWSRQLRVARPGRVEVGGEPDRIDLSEQPLLSLCLELREVFVPALVTWPIHLPQSYVVWDWTGLLRHCNTSQGPSPNLTLRHPIWDHVSFSSLY